MHVQKSLFVFLVLGSYNYVALADERCELTGNPACSTFPPGHRYLGPSWWAIGRGSFNATIMSLTASLLVPELPQPATGVIIINPSMENTVC